MHIHIGSDTYEITGYLMCTECAERAVENRGWELLDVIESPVKVERWDRVLREAPPGADYETRPQVHLNRKLGTYEVTRRRVIGREELFPRDEPR